MVVEGLSESEKLYLFNLSVVSITFVGFAGLFMAFRQAITGKTTKFDILLTKNHFLLSFMVVGGTLLPPLLDFFPLSSEAIWRISSVAVAIPPLVFAITYPRRRFKATSKPMPLGTKIIVFCLYLTAGVLLINAIGVPRPGAALYNLSVTFHQATNIVAYVYALKFILDEATPAGVVIPKLPE